MNIDPGVSLLAYATVHGNLPGVIQMVEEVGVDPEATLALCHNTPPITIAAGHGHLPIVQYFIERCGVDIDQTNDSGDAALTMAFAHNRIPCIQYLLQHNANPNLGKTGATPIFIASYRGFTDALRLLLQNRQTDLEVIYSNLTPLKCAYY